MAGEPLPSIRVGKLVIDGDYKNLDFLRQVSGVRILFLTLPKLEDVQPPPSVKASVHDLWLSSAPATNLRSLGQLTSLKKLMLLNMDVDTSPNLPTLRELAYARCG